MNVHIVGLDRLNRKLDRIRRDIKPDVMEATRRAVLFVHGEVPGYPDPPPGSRYRRTGLLGRSITTDVKTLGNAVVGTIGSDVDYAPWVISSERVGGAGPQAWMHRGRWWMLQNVVMQAREGVLQIFHEMVKRLLDKG